MKLSKKTFSEYQENFTGFCTVCRSFEVDDVELTAEDEFCPECSNFSVLGLKKALKLKEISIDDEEDFEEALDDSFDEF